jgi:hypothetical protein
MFTFPVWYGVVTGSSGAPPKLEKPAKGKECVESTAYMRANHMELLDTWRLDVVREGKRVYTSTKGAQYKMSLQNTCLDCHKSKANFCDKCHNYMDVVPKCWECHIQPEFRPEKKVAWRSE